MSQKIYRHVLRDAWSVTWRYPGLWILGAFALFFGQAQFFYSLFGLMQITAWGSSAATFFAGASLWYWPLFSINSKLQMLTGLGIGALLLLLVVLFVFLVVQSQGALIVAGEHIFRQKTYSWSLAWHYALEHFWSFAGLLAIKIIAAATGSAVLLSLTAWLAGHPANWLIKIIFVFGFVLLALIDITLTFLVLYASCYIGLEKDNIGEALRRGGKLLARHWLVSLEIGVLFLVANVLLQVVAKFVVAVLFVPLLYFAALVHAVTGTVVGITLLNLVIMLLAAWLLFAVFSTWFFMSVVCLFERMQSDTLINKTLRFLRGLVQRTE